MRLVENQQPVQQLAAQRADEPLADRVRARASGRDFHSDNAGAGQDRVEGFGELPGAVADQEPEVLGVIAEVHREVAEGL